MTIGDTFTLIGYPTTIFRAVKLYNIGPIRCVVGITLDGQRRTNARIIDVVVH